MFQCLNDKNDDRECYKQIDVGIILNGVCFATLSIILIGTVIPLFTALHTLQKGRMELTKGVKMLASVFGVFTFSYSTRTLYDWFIEANLVFANFFSGFTLPILWDFLPIFLMFAYHFQNLRVLQKPKQNKSSKAK